MLVKRGSPGPAERVIGIDPYSFFEQRQGLPREPSEEADCPSSVDEHLGIRAINRKRATRYGDILVCMCGRVVGPTVELKPHRGCRKTSKRDGEILVELECALQV